MCIEAVVMSGNRGNNQIVFLQDVSLERMEILPEQLPDKFQAKIITTKSGPALSYLLDANCPVPGEIFLEIGELLKDSVNVTESA